MRLAVIADDLTGALDAAAPFAGAGLTVSAPLGEDLNDTLTTARESDAAVLVVDLQTRSLAGGPAAERVFAVVTGLAGCGITHWFKKMDSTLRGPWAEELAALRRALAEPLALVCPAFPAQGRTGIGGVVRAGGQVVGDCGAELCRRGGMRVRSLPTGESLPSLVAALRRCLAEGSECVVADAQTDAHLDALVAAGGETSSNRLLCGSGGLAAAWARCLVAPSPHPASAGRPVHRILVAVGSRHAAARQQVQALCSQRPSLGAAVEICLLIAPPEDQAGGENPLVADILAEEAARHHAAGSGEALVLTGGQTARAILRGLDARCLAVLGEVEPGLPLSRVVGGEADGALCVTKAGGFGDDRTLLRVIDYLSTGGTATDAEPPPAGPDAR